MSLRRSGVQYAENSFDPCNLMKHEVEEYAETVARALEHEIGNPVEDCVESLGGRIAYQEMDEWIHEGGSIFVHAPLDFDILLPEYTSPRRDQFTIAHELGHYFLHSQQGEIPMVAFRRGSGRVEWEANWFAAGLLMPREEFVQAYKVDPETDSLAIRFGVSRDAASVRKKALNCGD